MFKKECLKKSVHYLVQFTFTQKERKQKERKQKEMRKKGNRTEIVSFRSINANT